VGIDMSDANKTPSEQLAEQIVSVLVEHQIILPEDAKLVNKLANGQLRAEDWRMVIEKAFDKESKNA
jgi:type III secretion system FlhB-like substrate exporter